MELTYKGTRPYTGFDGGKMISLRPGDSIDVSEKTAQRLMNDFPEDWKPATASAPAETGSKAEEEIPSVGSPTEPPEKPSGKVPKKNKAIAEPKKAKRK